MSKKRYLAAFGAAGVVFAGVYGAAASIGVDGGAIQVGQDRTLRCADNAVVESYRYENDGATSLGVRVTGLGDCEGEELFASVYRGSQLLADGNADITGDQVVVTWDSPVSAKKINKVRLAID